jgi:tetratricopeptide (TPR) repeat protein
MRLGSLTARLVRSFRAWERPAQLAFLLALPFLVVTFVLMVTGGPDIRPPATFGFIGFVLVAQVIFMWANRKMVTPYTQAQRHYLKEDFASARRVLEESMQAGKAPLPALTLLGNTYRQLGLLEKSEAILTKAVANSPEDHFSLYGIGRTLLIKGEYARAIDAIERAIQHGGPPIIQLDLAEAYYRAGQPDTALNGLVPGLAAATEPHRVLLGRYLLYRLGGGNPPTRDELTAGLPYWVEQAARYASTVYGQALSTDVDIMNGLLEGSTIHDL